MLSHNAVGIRPVFAIPFVDVIESPVVFGECRNGAFVAERMFMKQTCEPATIDYAVAFVCPEIRDTAFVAEFPGGMTLGV